MAARRPQQISPRSSAAVDAVAAVAASVPDPVLSHFACLLDAIDAVHRVSGPRMSVERPLAVIAAQDGAVVPADPWAKSIVRTAHALLHASETELHDACAAALPARMPLPADALDAIAAFAHPLPAVRLAYATDVLDTRRRSSSHRIVHNVVARWILGTAHVPMCIAAPLRRSSGIEACSKAIRVAVEDATTLGGDVKATAAWMRERVHSATRSDASARPLIDLLAMRPVVSVRAAADAIGRTFQATNEGLAALERLGLVTHDHSRHRHRVFKAAPLIDTLDSWFARRGLRP